MGWVGTGVTKAGWGAGGGMAEGTGPLQVGWTSEGSGGGMEHSGHKDQNRRLEDGVK